MSRPLLSGAAEQRPVLALHLRIGLTHPPARCRLFLLHQRVSGDPPRGLLWSSVQLAAWQQWMRRDSDKLLAGCLTPWGDCGPSSPSGSPLLFLEELSHQASGLWPSASAGGNLSRPRVGGAPAAACLLGCPGTPGVWMVSLRIADEEEADCLSLLLASRMFTAAVVRSAMASPRCWAHLQRPPWLLHSCVHLGSIDVVRYTKSINIIYNNNRIKEKIHGHLN